MMMRSRAFIYRGSCFTQRRKNAKSNAISLKLLCALAPLRETHFRFIALSWKLFHAKAQRRKVKCDISECSFVPWRLCVKLTFALSLYRGSCFTQSRKDAKSNAISLNVPLCLGAFA